jgi:hypothetical protein
MYDEIQEANDEKGSGIVLADTIVALFAFFFLLFILQALLPNMQNQEQISKSWVNGDLCATLNWSNDRNVDLDIWGNAPNETKPVGYSHMHGANLDLFRDVIGFTNNPAHINEEIMCARQVVPGEYTFNAHYFNNWEPLNKTSVQARITVTYHKEGEKDVILSGTFDLVEGEEKTMIDFLVDENLNIVEKSINTQQIYLRSEGK